MLDKQQATLLKQFITVIKQKPEIIHQPDLAFFKEWLLSLGAKLPEPTSKPTTRKDEEDIEELGDNDDMPDIEDIPNEPEGGKKEESESEEEIESDVELEELDNLIKDEEDIEVKYPQESFEHLVSNVKLDLFSPKLVTEEMRDESNVKRCEAMAALGDGNLASALSLFTEAVMKNPTSANLYAKRASVLIKMKKPKAAIKDCDKALSFNKDCAQPYKWRGRAHRLLGNYEEAYHDFQMSCHLDMDETVYEWQKEVEKNAKNIMEHRRKYERINEERKRKEAQKRREEYERVKMEEAERKSFPGGGFPGGMPGGGAGGFPGGMPGGAQGGMPDLNDLLRDPELLSAMQDPEVMAAFQDVSQNPANMAKYENNLKIKKVMEKLQKKFGGAAAPPGGM